MTAGGCASTRARHRPGRSRDGRDAGRGAVTSCNGCAVPIDHPRVQDLEQGDNQKMPLAIFARIILGHAITLGGYSDGQLVGQLIGISHAGSYRGGHTDLTVEWDRDQTIVVRRRLEELVTLWPLPEPEMTVHIPADDSETVPRLP